MKTQMKKYAAGGAKPKAKKPMTGGEAAKKLIDSTYNAGAKGLKIAQQGAGRVVKDAVTATNVLGAALNPIGTAVKVMNAAQKAQAKSKAPSNQKSYTDSKGGKTTVSKNANGSKTVVYKKGDVKTTKTSSTKPGTSSYKSDGKTSTKFTPNVTKSTTKVEAPKGTTIKNDNGSKLKAITYPKPPPVAPKPAPKKSSDKTKTSSKSEEVTPLATRKATEISIARPEPVKTPVKQKFGEKVKAKISEAITNRREKKLAKLKSKLGQMKTGGMVNPNASVNALRTAGSHGVKPGVNPKAAASNRAGGRVGGTSVAPKTAAPKAKYGMSMTKMKKR